MHNGRRLIAVPVVNPAVDGTWVLGYGSFLLDTDGGIPSNFYKTTTNGNDAFCATYVGPYVFGGRGTGGATGGSGAYRIKLVS